MIIDLSDLPPEGRSFEFTHESGEMTPQLTDLLGKHPYRIEILVRPLGNIFEASGVIQGAMDQVCSLCGDDLLKGLNQPFRELLMIQEPLGRSTKNTRVNHTSEMNLEAPEVTELSGQMFDMAEFIHELIAISIPIRVTARPDCEESCERYQEVLKLGVLNAQDPPGFAAKNPFAGLKDLKLNR